MTPQASVLLNDSLVANVCCVTEAPVGQPKFDLHEEENQTGESVSELGDAFVRALGHFLTRIRSMVK